jgi:hypothetical protein
VGELLVQLENLFNLTNAGDLDALGSGARAVPLVKEHLRRLGHRV